MGFIVFWFNAGGEKRIEESKRLAKQVGEIIRSLPAERVLAQGERICSRDSPGNFDQVGNTPAEDPAGQGFPKADKAAMYWQHSLANRKRLGGSSATHQGTERRDELPQPRQHP